jgi:hypothetical protein
VKHQGLATEWGACLAEVWERELLLSTGWGKADLTYAMIRFGRALTTRNVKSPSKQLRYRPRLVTAWSLGGGSRSMPHSNLAKQAASRVGANHSKGSRMPPASLAMF